MSMPLPDALDLTSAWITREGEVRVHEPAQTEAPQVSQARRASAAGLRAPLRAASLTARLALEQARRHRDPAALVKALDAVDQLMGALEAADALDELLASAADQHAPGLDRIEPGPWLRAAWATLEPLAAARQVTGRLVLHGDEGSLGAIYGHAGWLTRLLREWLESAVNGASGHDMLEIEYRQMGPRALVSLRNSAAFKAPHDQARWALCQHIAHWHGGELRLECDDEQQDWLLDLPSGAPAHAESTASHEDQARRFVQDFAALRARAERRSAAARQTPNRPAAGDTP